jgi:hypothetical protein
LIGCRVNFLLIFKTQILVKISFFQTAVISTKNRLLFSSMLHFSHYLSLQDSRFNSRLKKYLFSERQGGVTPLEFFILIFYFIFIYTRPLVEKIINLLIFFLNFYRMYLGI